MKNLLLIALAIFSFSTYSQEVSESDKNALVALYNSTNGANWTNTWDLNDLPQNWYGVEANVVFTADGPKRIIQEINLIDNNLEGTIPVDLGNLKDLNTLNLSNNNITGSIPGGLGNAEDLNYLYLQNNSLSGDIPGELFSLNERHFVEINLSFNKLTGKLPEELGNNSIANVGAIFVSNNLLTDLPDYTNSSLFRIETLDISNNNIPFSVFGRVSFIFDNIAKVLEDNVATLTYSPQNKINDIEQIAITGGENTSFSVTGLTNIDNTYQWFQNGTLIPGATNATYQITNASATDTGTYYCEIKNPNVPNLTLQRNDITLDVNVFLSDRDALIALYNATDGSNWSNPWDLTADISTWFGVAVNVDGRVTSLVLDSQGLKGTLPSEIQHLTGLTFIRIAHNEDLTGPIPPEIGNLPKLETLWMSNNNLNGSIPNEITQLPVLKTLRLSRNNLIGELPVSFTDLVNLEVFEASDNNLEGPLPTTIGNMSSLKRFVIVRNDFSGPIPSSIGSLPNLEIFWALSNELTGEIPVEIGNLINATKIDLRNNNLTGTIPSSFTNLVNMLYIQVGGNDLSGDIPNFIWSMNWLAGLDIGQNDFTGSIPSEISNLTNLSRLNLGNTDISGFLPVEIWALTNLSDIDLENIPTLEPWSIPNEIRNLTNLYQFDVRNSNLTGTLPDVFDSFPNLDILDVANNDLSGAMPSTLSALTNVRYVNLHNNNFSGVLPDLNATTVQSFNVTNNDLIFSDIENKFTTYSNNTMYFSFSPQQKLGTEEELTLEEGANYIIEITETSSPNNVYQWRKNGIDILGETGLSISFTAVSTLDSGTYDCIITNPNVPGLTLERNAVTINIFSAQDKAALLALYNATDGPNWTTPWDLSKSINQWSGVLLNTDNRVEQIRFFNNNLKGELPAEIGEISELRSINISLEEDLTGVIPNSITNLTKLEVLNLQGNNFSGLLPEFLSDIPSLKELSLSRNSFTGSIPEIYGNLLNLEYLALSENDLEGEIPASLNNLSKLTSLWLYGNPKLSGSIPNLNGLINLKFINLSNTNLTGSIPNLNGLINLTYINLSNTNLTGNVPDLSGLINLSTIDLSYTDLTGAFPDFLWDLTNIRLISLDKVKFDEYQIPERIANLTNLQAIDLDDTNLSGSLPNVFNSLTNLINFRASQNNLTGQIPPSFASLPKIETVSLFGNNLSGSIPTTISNDVKLYIFSNNFVFEDIEPVVNDYNGSILYANQAKIDTEMNVSIFEREETILTVDQTNSPNNLYQWQKDDIDILGATSSTYTLTNAQVENSGTYSCIITNSALPDLTLMRNSIEVTVNIVDSDVDGISDFTDLCLNTPQGEAVDANGCGQTQLDDDNDGVFNNLDQCVGTPEGETVDINGCSQLQLDIDGDGVLNDIDLCANTPTSEAVDANGCAQSQLDDDNDGVFNTLDLCPNTPMGETVNADGCSSSQLDDDNDGANNAVDLCPNTPAGETANTEGCSSSQLDDDNDGVFNNLDLCPGTPAGETANAEGCAPSQLDGDNDGVNNDKDQCPNTVIGDIIDANGCSLDQLVVITPNDIQILATSTTCPEVANGEITISFTKDYLYTVSLKSTTENRNFNDVHFNTDLVIENLEANAYEVTITIPSVPNFEQSYTLQIEAPESLKVFENKIDKKIATYTVSGSMHYSIMVNSEHYEFNFADINAKEIKLELQAGTNNIEIKTDKVCQGKFNKTITGDTLQFYPNPANGHLTISGTIEANTSIILTDVTGKVVLYTTIPNKNKGYTLPLDTIVSGIYMVTITNQTQTINTKIVKK